MVDLAEAATEPAIRWLIEFVVTQGAQSVSCLTELESFFGVGQVLANKRYDNHREHLYR